MSEEKTDVVGDVFGYVGTIIAIYFYLAPAVPFYQVLTNKLSYKDSPGVLLIMSFLNCILWADYGLVKNDFMVYFANGIGGTITLVFITVFLIFLGKKNLLLAGAYNLALMVVLVGTLLLFYFVVPMNVTGYAAMIFNVLMYAAPGEKIYRVFTTQNYKLIPIFSTMGGVACSLCWLMYGIYGKDLNLIIPNALGLMFAILQVTIYLFFYLKTKDKAVEFPGENDEVV